MFANIKKSPGKLAYSKVLSIIILGCVGILVYSNTFHSPFQFDDEHAIFENLSIRNLSNLRNVSGSSRFIGYLTFAVNYHFHQYNVFGYHLFNLIIHLGSAILVWWLTLLTLSTPAMKDNKITHHSNLIAFFVGLVFVAHPVQIQAVTYIIQRTTSLVIFFYLASLCFYVKWRLSQINGLSLAIRILCFFGFLIAATLGMFTKELILTLPLMILLYELCFLRIRDFFNWKYLVVILVLLLVVYNTIVAPKFKGFSSIEEVLSAEVAIPPGRYILTQFRVLVTYLRLFFLPINQNIDYDYPVVKTILGLPVLTSIFLLVLILFIAFRTYSRYRLISFSIFWFFISLSQEFTVMPIYFFLAQSSREVIFEERLYLPMVGYSLFLVSATYYLFGQKTLKQMVAILFVIVGLYGILTYNRNAVWKDEFTLWSDAVRKSPKKARPYSNRGRAYAYKEDYAKAISDFNKAIEISPNFSDAYYNRGHVYKDKGNIDQAISDYTKATQLYPDFVKAYYNRGNIYKEIGELDRAISDYSKAIEINSNHIKAYTNRGNVYKDKGNIDQAISDYNKAIEINPDFFEIYYNRGNAYKVKGDLNQAISDYNKAIQIKPNSTEAYSNRGNAYKDRGDFVRAIADYNRAIEINPNYAIAYYNRAVTYFRRQEYNKAWKDVHRAEALGYKVRLDFIEALKKASGRDW